MSLLFRLTFHITANESHWYACTTRIKHIMTLCICFFRAGVYKTDPDYSETKYQCNMTSSGYAPRTPMSCYKNQSSRSDWSVDETWYTGGILNGSSSSFQPTAAAGLWQKSLFNDSDSLLDDDVTSTKTIINGYTGNLWNYFKNFKFCPAIWRVLPWMPIGWQDNNYKVELHSRGSSIIHQLSQQFFFARCMAYP